MTKDEILTYISDGYADDLVLRGVAVENTQRNLFYVIDDASKGATDDQQKAIADKETRQLIRDRSAYMGIEIPVWPDEQVAPEPEDNTVPDPIPASVLNEGQSDIPLLDDEDVEDGEE